MRLERGINIGSLDDFTDIDYGAKCLARGEPVVAHAGTVIGIFVNADDPTAVTRALATKGEVDGPENKPLSVIMKSDRLAQLVDLDRVDPSLRKLFANPAFIGRLAGICHLRVPVVAYAKDFLPPSIVSVEGNTPYIHGLDIGDRPLNGLFEAARNVGVRYIACTTWNDGGEKEREIVTKERALEFMSERPAVSLFYLDSHPSPAVGSYTILDTQKNLFLRDGHVPARIIQKILGVNVSMEGMPPVKHPQLPEFNQLLSKDLSPLELRQRVINIVFPHHS